MKTVSVIIPCYRDSATLERAINSVLSQSYPAIEIIVVNDCSPESGEIERIVARFPKVHYMRNDSNLGLAGTRNAGIAVASGDYIALLDADDEYHPEKIEVQVAATEPGVALTCGVMHVFPNGRRTTSRIARHGSRIFSRPNQIIFRNTLNGAGILIERSLLIKHGCFDESLRSCEDFDLWLRLLSKGVKIKEISWPLYFYYANPAGLSKNFLNISVWEIQTIRKYAARVGESWLRSPEGILVGSVWLTRQMIRCELHPSSELTQQVIENINILGIPAWLTCLLRFINKNRLLILPALIVKLLQACDYS